ncbi:MAG: hypothetical protein ACYDDZ_07265 [Acidimicrobiales bacterium]
MFRGGNRAAESELSRLVAAAEDEPLPPPVVEALRWNLRTTVNNAIEGWKDNGREDLSASTVRRNENMWMKHVHGSIAGYRAGQRAVREFEQTKVFGVLPSSARPRN